MISKDACIKAVKSFRAKQGIEAADENIIATIHLMNTHGMDLHSAMDQSSRSGNDHGVDAWFYDDKANELFIYQSKLTENRALALHGLGDLDYSRQWLEEVLINGTVTTVPDNHCLFNLYTTLANKKESVRKISFLLLSPFEKNEMEDLLEYDEFTKGLIKSKLNDFIRQARSGKLVAGLMQYNLESGLPEKIKTYPITKIPNARIDLRKKAYLDLAYISLYSLVELYRQRGNVLFDKNVRLSLMNNKEAKDRLVHPLEETLDKITKGEISPNIFPFYHIGVTIAASASTDEDNSLLNLEAPSIINGCQTITIAQEYLKQLEKTQNEEAIDRFKQVKVVAKVVVGTSNEELKEITNANNRQNPIENWQLFSNEPIHIEIEQTLKDYGIFYERQKGKFDSLMKNADNAKYFPNTNGTFIKVVDLAQVIALAKNNIQWAAKPSDIFLNKLNHDKSNLAGHKMVYTLDGSEPTTNSAIYTAPIALPMDRSVTVRAASLLPDGKLGISGSRVFAGLMPIGWKVVSVDSEETVGADNSAARAIDGDSSTYWHTRWNADQKQPHSITVDMGKTNRIAGFTYLPRQDGLLNGVIDKYRFETSTDNVIWTTDIANGSFANIQNNPSLQEVNFAPVNVRYFRFTSLHAIWNSGWTSAAEISVLPAAGSGD